jgi:hypothetical protein
MPRLGHRPAARRGRPLARCRVVLRPRSFRPGRSKRHRCCADPVADPLLRSASTVVWRVPAVWASAEANPLRPVRLEGQGKRPVLLLGVRAEVLDSGSLVEGDVSHPLKSNASQPHSGHVSPLVLSSSSTRLFWSGLSSMNFSPSSYPVRMVHGPTRPSRGSALRRIAPVLTG